MTHRHLVVMGALAVVIAVVSLSSAPAAGQAATAASKTWTGRTPWGEPDLRGVWRNETNTPLERPAALAGKEFYTEEEAAALVKKRVEAEAPLLAAGVPEGPSP